MDDAVLHKDGFHVLTANVEDERYFGVDMLCRQEVCDGLDDAVVQLEGGLHQVFAITRRTTA